MGFLGQSKCLIMAVIHKFHESNAKAENEKNDPFWLDVYKEAFPDMINAMPLREDCKMQRRGVDRVIILDSGKSVYIDEKIRFSEYNDILLEYISVDTTNAPGWIEKDLCIDYLAYAFIKSKRCYLFDWRMLKRAWRYYGERWKAQYNKIEANNNDYKTILR